MLFTDPLFLFYFLPVTLVVLRLLSINGRLGNRFKIALILATLVFYAYANWLWVLVFLLVAAGAYGCGWLVRLSSSSVTRRLWLGISLAYVLGILAVFKYLNWFSEIIPGLVSLRDFAVPWFGSGGKIVLPPGISFYSFEAISYVFDIYRRKVNPPKNPFDFLCFIAMFPRFIAGPIVRYADLENQIREWAGMKVSRGLTLFAIGFCLKSLFADQFSVFVPYGFGVPNPDLIQAWLGVSCYSLQLYFDFWSYSIMATGIGLCLGFEFPDNFRSPYHAASITQFWRQWHISLSSWLRDYLYIPLGGSRCSSARTYSNILITMLLGGIWHGANYTFLIWGGYHGLLLVGERAVGEERLQRVPAFARHVVTLVLVSVGWALFRSEGFRQAIAVVSGMAGLHGIGSAFNPLLIEKNLFAGGLSLFGLLYCAFGERSLVGDLPIAGREFSRVIQWGVLGLFLAAIVVVLSSTEIPFLYFQF